MLTPTSSLEYEPREALETLSSWLPSPNGHRTVSTAPSGANLTSRNVNVRANQQPPSHPSTAYELGVNIYPRRHLFCEMHEPRCCQHRFPDPE